jgi:hypothetical protein
MGPTEKPTTELDIEVLNGLALRLSEQADAVLARRDTAKDMRLASRVCDRLAHLRFEIGEIIGKCADQDAVRELRDALEEAARVD